MLNSEVFEQFGTEKWVVEQNLCYLLQIYWEKYGTEACEQASRGYKVGRTMPYNPISFVKEFMKEETLCNIEYAEKSKMNTVEKSVVIDVEATEVNDC